LLSQIKEKHIHQLTAYMRLRLLYKSLHPYFAPLRSAKHQIHANVIWHAGFPFLP